MRTGIIIMCSITWSAACREQEPPATETQSAAVVVDPMPTQPVATVAGNYLNAWDDQFGAAIAIGDFDGDTHPDIAVAAPHDYHWPAVGQGAGAVILFRGFAGGFAPWHDLYETDLDEVERFDYFGHALATGDFDDDGYEDLAVGAHGEAPPGTDQASGAVFLFRGGPPGLIAWEMIDQEILGLGLNERGDQFGFALSAGDYNGDGRADLAIGAPGESWPGGVKAGAVFVARGTPAGMAGVGTLRQEDLAPAVANNRFGSSLAGGNFLAASSAYDDLVVGCYNDQLDAVRIGRVYVYEGSPGGPAPHEVLDQNGALEEDDQFGRSFAVGRFDEDSWDDLAVGAPGEDGHGGAVYTYRGGSAGLLPGAILRRADFPGAPDADRFGYALAAGDFNDDDLDDLAVGAPRSRALTTSGPRSGRVFIYRSAGNVMSPLGILTQQYLDQNEADDYFGFALATGDLSLDGRADLIVGAPREKASVLRDGAAYGYLGTDTLLEAWRRLYQEDPSMP